MATLGPFAGPHQGNLRIWAQILLAYVGNGRFTYFEDYRAEFQGSYQVFSQSGNITIGVELSDRNPTAASGQCVVSLNGKTDNAASYQANGNKLTITTALNNTGIDMYSYENGTQFDNVSGHNFWIGP
jgi:hypothetical protein